MNKLNDHSSREVVILTGSTGMLGVELLKGLRANCTVITLGRGGTCDYPYDLTGSVARIIPDDIKITKFIHLAYDHAENFVNDEDSNIHAMRDIARYCQDKGILLIYASSMAALSANSKYGINKLICERICEGYKNSVILRLGMLYGESAGLIHKINKLVSVLPFLPMPGDGHFLVYLSNIVNVVNYICNAKYPIGGYQYLIDSEELFCNLIHKNSNIRINIPIFIIKGLLYIPHALGVRLRSISYDGFLGLINPPQLPAGVQNYETN